MAAAGCEAEAAAFSVDAFAELPPNMASTSCARACSISLNRPAAAVALRVVLVVATAVVGEVGAADMGGEGAGTAGEVLAVAAAVGAAAVGTASRVPVWPCCSSTLGGAVAIMLAVVCASCFGFCEPSSATCRLSRFSSVSWVSCISSSPPSIRSFSASSCSGDMSSTILGGGGSCELDSSAPLTISSLTACTEMGKRCRLNFAFSLSLIASWFALTQRRFKAACGTANLTRSEVCISAGWLRVLNLGANSSCRTLDPPPSDSSSRPSLTWAAGTAANSPMASIMAIFTAQVSAASSAFNMQWCGTRKGSFAVKANSPIASSAAPSGGAGGAGVPDTLSSSTGVQPGAVNWKQVSASRGAPRQGLPPCSAAISFLARLRVPCPHCVEHGVQSPQSCQSQSTGQGSGWHIFWAIVSESRHIFPPWAPCTKIPRVLFFAIERPHAGEQSPQSLQSWYRQSTGQTSVAQLSLKTSASGHSAFSGSFISSSLPLPALRARMR
mmetsp:Transcript_92793/g.266822  ORF Transcript_92793/g.266822 Transcript_92793/m.266822 type:complete len:498 (-) Transcript_92793:570-2063(-)